MIRFLNILALLFLFSGFGYSQEIKSIDVDYEEKISSLLDFSIPMVTIKDFKEIKSNVILLDAREPDEFDVSHIPGALNIGYDNLNEEVLKGLNHDDTIVLYCSVGYRSEKMGERLLNQGFDKVYNLYGSIFQWANEGNDLETKTGQSTKKIHTYSRSWSKWLVNPDYVKIY